MNLNYSWVEPFATYQDALNSKPEENTIAHIEDLQKDGKFYVTAYDAEKGSWSEPILWAQATCGPMNFNQYQQKTQDTAIYPGKGTFIGLAYCGLGLGESGEVQGKIKKILRDAGGEVTDEKASEIGKELGDMLWYIAATAQELGLNLQDIAEANIAKLKSRQERGVLQGSGDNR